MTTTLPSVSRATYLAVYLALLALLALSIVANQRGAPWDSLAIGMAIAGVKTLLIVVYFMHLRYAGAMPRLIAAAALFWLAILFGLTFSDYPTRDRLAAEIKRNESLRGD